LKPPRPASLCEFTHRGCDASLAPQSARSALLQLRYWDKVRLRSSAKVDQPGVQPRHVRQFHWKNKLPEKAPRFVQVPCRNPTCRLKSLSANCPVAALENMKQRCQPRRIVSRFARHVSYVEKLTAG